MGNRINSEPVQKKIGLESNYELMKRSSVSPVISQGDLFKVVDFQKMADLTYCKKNTKSFLKSIILKVSYVETEALYNLFSKAAAPNKELTQPRFYQLYPNFSKDPRIQKSLFKAINQSKNGYDIQFPQFLKTLGIMCRGNAKEKAELALEIINYNKDPKIDKKEIADFCIAMQSLIGLENSDHLVENVIDDIINSSTLEKKKIFFLKH